MTNHEKDTPLVAADAPARTKPSNYPEPFASMMAQRIKRPLGDIFGLTHFGVNLTTVLSKGTSSLRHAHSEQDEFIYVVSGVGTLVTNDGEFLLSAGACCGFKAGTGNAHTIRNDSSEDLTYLEIGDRCTGDQVTYPDDDLVAKLEGDQWVFVHKDGTAY